MLNKRSATLAALLVLGAASGALATEFDPNPGNRFPAANAPLVGTQYDSAGFLAPHASRMPPSRYRDVGLPFTTRAPRAIRTGRDEAPTAGGGY